MQQPNTAYTDGYAQPYGGPVGMIWGWLVSSCLIMRTSAHHDMTTTWELTFSSVVGLAMVSRHEHHTDARKRAFGGARLIDCLFDKDNAD